MRPFSHCAETIGPLTNNEGCYLPVSLVLTLHKFLGDKLRLHVKCGTQFRSPRKENPGENNLFQQQRDSGAILLAFDLSTVSCQALKHILTVHKTHDSLLMIWFRSLVSGLLPRSLSLLGRHYSRVLRHLCNVT